MHLIFRVLYAPEESGESHRVCELSAPTQSVILCWKACTR